MASFGDFNKVNTNVTAMEARLSLNKINSELGDSRLKLSTGYKINKAEDDSAGFAIATKLRSRITGLEQALQNVSDAKSVMDIIEGGYSSIMDNLIEMKGLATQAANDTFSATERTLIAKQIQSLGYDINDIADSTKFNGIALNPSAANGGDTTLTFQTGEGTSDTYTFNLRQVDVLSLFGNTSLDSAGSDIVSAVDQALLSGANDPKDDRGEIDFTIAAVEAGEAGTGTATEVDALATDFRDLMTAVDAAVAKLNGYMNEIGIDQRSMSGKEVNLTEAISANSAAKSRIMDVDFAKEQSNSVRLQILQQTATAALSQANMGPQAVLGFLGQ
jgi:flagellin